MFHRSNLKLVHNLELHLPGFVNKQAEGLNQTPSHSSSWIVSLKSASQRDLTQTVFGFDNVRILNNLLHSQKTEPNEVQFNSRSDKAAFLQISEKVILRKVVLLSELIKGHHSAIHHQVAHSPYTPTRP